MSISIAIVEHKKNSNNALKKVISYQHDMRVVEQFFDGNEALRNLSGISPDVVMMNIQLQDLTICTTILVPNLCIKASGRKQKMKT